MKKLIIVITSIALSFGIMNSTFAKKHYRHHHHSSGVLSDTGNTVKNTSRGVGSAADSAIKGTGRVISDILN